MTNNKQSPKSEITAINSVNKFGAKPVSICLVDIAAEQGKTIIQNPIKVIGDRIPSLAPDQIRGSLQSLKNAKLIKTNSNKGVKFTKLEVTKELCELVYQNLANHIPIDKYTGPAIKTAVSEAFEGFMEKYLTKASEKQICIFVDYDNIMLQERTVRERVSYAKLKKYARQFGAVVLPFVFVPDNYMKDERMKKYFRWCEYIRIPAEISQKQTDQVDYHIRDMIRRVSQLNPNIEFWIVSRDSDFIRIRELAKDLNLNEIKMINPFEIPEVLGLEELEEEAYLSRKVHQVVKTAKLLKPRVAKNEHPREQMLRLTVRWLEGQPDTISFSHRSHFVSVLEMELKKSVGKIPSEPSTHEIIIGLTELNVITQLEDKSKFVLEIDKSHEIFVNAIPQEWRQKVAMA